MSYILPQSTVELYIFIALLSKTPLTPHIPLNLSHWNSRSEFPQFSALSSWAKGLLPLGEKLFTLWQEDTGQFMECYQIVNRFQRPLDTISDISRHMLVFYFLQTPEKLPPKYASFAHQRFSWVFLRIYSDRTDRINNFLTYFYSGFIDLTSKYSKTPLYPLRPALPHHLCFHFCLRHLFPLECKLPTVTSALYTFFILGSFYIQSLKFFFNSGINFFFFFLSLIFRLLFSPYL